MYKKRNPIISSIARMTFLAAVLLVTACATGDPDSGRRMPTLLQGVMNLVLSVAQISVGLMEGVSSLPYYANTSLTDINNGMVQTQAKITLDDTYEGAYGKRISQVNPSGDTGELFRRMKHATQFFQRVLSHYGVADASNYYLTSIDTAKNDGYTLFAVVYRPIRNIAVIDKYNNKTLRNFSSDDRLFYEPFQFDAKGNPLDVIVDWAGLPNNQFGTQKQQAILLTLAANAVVSDKKRTDYWEAEKRWIDGQYAEIVQVQTQRVEQAMKL